MNVVNELYQSLPRISKYSQYEVSEANVNHFWNDLYKLEAMLDSVERTKDKDFAFGEVLYDKAGAIRRLKWLISIIQHKLRVFVVNK